MAFLDDVMDQLAVSVGAFLAPFQPNLPPDYPNAQPSAGYIPPTIIGAGHPIQVKVLHRLENHMAQVSIYPYTTEKVMPYYDSQKLITLPNGLETFQTGRSEKAMIIEVWSYDRPTRAAISNVIRGYLGDFYRQTELDTTTTTLRFAHAEPFDNEQSDSVYVQKMFYVADFDVLQIPVGQISYLVEEVDVSMTVNNQVLGVVVRNRGSNPPAENPIILDTTELDSGATWN